MTAQGRAGAGSFSFRTHKGATMTIYRPFLAACLLLLCSIASSTFASEEVLKVRFTWKIKGEYAPLYVAQDKGLFAQNGLNVTMAEGAGGQAALAALIQGQEDVVVVPGVYALTTVSKGMPIKLIALYHPATPLAMFSFASNPVRVPRDLEGKKIATSFDTFSSYMHVFCGKNGIDCDKVAKVRVNITMQQQLFVGHQVDAFGGYLDVDWPLLQTVTEEPLVYLDLTKYGMIVPGLAIAASDDMIVKRPDALRKFLAAVGSGLVMTRADVSGATDILMKSWAVAPSRKVVKEQIQAAINFVPPDRPDRPVGWIDETILDDALNTLKETKEIEARQAMDKYYTNALLAK
jgi:NitT/TauT family transport system substrate-binding protein